MLAVMAVVLGVILMPALRAMLAGEAVVPGELGAELGAPADPSLPYAAARPEWYFLFLFQFLKVFEGWGATGEFFGAIVVPGLIMTVMFLMPILGNWRLGHRFNVAFTLAVLAGVGLLTSLALNEDYYALWVDKASLAEAEKLHDQTGGDPEKLAAALDNDTAKVAAMTNQWKKLERVRHSQAFLEASRQAKADAARAIELAGRPEKIPPAGMLELVRHDPKSQGPRLFAQHCASCHSHVDPASAQAKTKMSKASAANLYGFGSVAWMQGLLDPAEVDGPAYFGNTSHNNGDMVNFVKNDLSDTSAWSSEDIRAVIVAMAAEANVYDTGIPESDISLIERGRALISDENRCGSCHDFGINEVNPNMAPDLVGWGSREWLIGIITNPAHEKFYGTQNDRMPSFGVTTDGAIPRLSLSQIELVVDWIRGQWYRSRSFNPSAHHASEK